jgi:hypothetical protein
MKDMMQRNLSRRVFLSGSLAVGGLAVVSRTLCDADPSDPEKSAADFITPQTERVIQKGLDFIASRQEDDGAFGASGYRRNVAVCALSGMALMASGSTPGRGPYGKQIDKCVDYLLANTHNNGFICDAPASSHGPMYGHGFATLFLAQAYGMSKHQQLREKLTKAVRLIVTTQNSEGGWRYQPQPTEADISVTVCEVMALRAARNAGLHVPNETIDRCIEYVKKSQNPDGGFRYMLSGGPSAFPRSAAGIVALYSAGVYEGAAIERGIKYLFQYLPRGRQLGRTSHYFYGHYYAIQAMWHAGDNAWAAWYPAIRDELINMQQAGGYWADSICQEYSTAMACLILQVPNNSLPIFQR